MFTSFYSPKYNLRLNNISDLQKHGSEDHCTTVKDTIETKTDRKVEQDICESMKKCDYRCHKCSYVLFAEDTHGGNSKTK